MNCIEIFYLANYFFNMINSIKIIFIIFEKPYKYCDVLFSFSFQFHSMMSKSIYLRIFFLIKINDFFFTSQNLFFFFNSKLFALL